MPLRIKSNLLREIRKTRGLSGYDLQILSKISAQEIYLIERGVKKPLPHQKHMIAKALNISAEHIFPKNLESNQEVVQE